MRSGSLFMIFACVALITATPAQAQNTQLYLSPGMQDYYATGANVPVYNNAAQPLPMEQLIAGKNAPSYNYNAPVQPYNLGGTTAGGSTNMSGAPLSPAQVAQMRANRNAQAQQYEQQYLQQAQQQISGVSAPEGYMGNPYSAAYGQQQIRPTKKRLLYKERDDLMPVPPRLFNPDQ